MSLCMQPTKLVEYIPEGGGTKLYFKSDGFFSLGKSMFQVRITFEQGLRLTAKVTSQPMIHDKWPNHDRKKVIKATTAKFALMKGTHSYRTHDL